jgi:uncharacterized membrane protein YphA (DoxX/SURF4 family)/thiol-disulfide isomerase/thioredoxin
MPLLLLVAIFILVAVFAVSAVAKWRDLPGTRQAVEAFGVPPALAQWLAPSLPVAETGAALLLVIPQTVVWGAAASLLLLGLFTAAIAVNLLRGRRPDCHCFGQLHSAPIGRSTIVRNLLLLAVAFFILLVATDTVTLVTPLWAPTVWQVLELGLVLLLLSALALQGWFIYHLLHQNGRLLVRMAEIEARLGLASLADPAKPQGLPVGAAAPEFSLQDVLTGEWASVSALAQRGLPLLLIFSDPLCGPCNALLPRIAQWQQQHKTRLLIAVVSSGEAEKVRFKQQEHNLAFMYLQRNREASAGYQAYGTPSAVLIVNGMIGSPLAPGEVAIAQLVDDTVGGSRLQIPLRSLPASVASTPLTRTLAP